MIIFCADFLTSRAQMWDSNILNTKEPIFFLSVLQPSPALAFLFLMCLPYWANISSLGVVGHANTLAWGWCAPLSSLHGTGSRSAFTTPPSDGAGKCRTDSSRTASAATAGRSLFRWAVAHLNTIYIGQTITRLTWVALLSFLFLLIRRLNDSEIIGDT